MSSALPATGSTASWSPSAPIKKRFVSFRCVMKSPLHHGMRLRQVHGEAWCLPRHIRSRWHSSVEWSLRRQARRPTRRDQRMKPKVVAWELGKLLRHDAIVSCDSGTITRVGRGRSLQGADRCTHSPAIWPAWRRACLTPSPPKSLIPTGNASLSWGRRILHADG